MIPTQCHLWQKENLTVGDLEFESIKIYFDYSHDWRSLCKCKKCGQLYVCNNTEHVDWIEGNDTIDTTFIPVSEEELGKYNFEGASPIELLGFSPILFLDPNNNVKWVRNNPLKN